MTASGMSRTLDEYRADGQKGFPSFTWPGAYPLIYVTEGGDVLCADCATKEVEAWRNTESDDPVVAYDAHYEGPPEICADCNKVIESAYGDPDEES